MKNIEKFKDVLKEKSINNFCLNCYGAKYQKDYCDEISSCRDCEFFRNENIIEWLLEEYQEPQKLTENDVELLKALLSDYREIRISNTGYIILHRGNETDHIYLNGYFEHLEKNHTHNIKALLDNYVEV